MNSVRLSMITAIAAGMLFTASTCEANVRDPISRKFQAEKGFFTNRNIGKTTTYSGSRTVVYPQVVTRPQVITQGVAAPVPQYRAQPQYRVQPRYIWSR